MEKGYKIIDTNSWNRKKTYDWFKSFDNPCYSVSTKIDVTSIVKYSKESNSSFFINLLYLVVQSLNSVEEMRMRYVDNQAVIYDEINPGYTVMTVQGDFENIRHENFINYQEFYNASHECIENAKKQLKLKEEDYNPKVFNEFYITCLPWLDFTQMTHPLPNNLESLSVPRICWGKYKLENDKYYLNFNITVNHMFIDGYALCKCFNLIQENINNYNNFIK